MRYSGLATQQVSQSLRVGVLGVSDGGLLLDRVDLLPRFDALVDGSVLPRR